MKKNIYRLIFELALIGGIAFLILTLDSKQEQVNNLKLQLANQDSVLVELKNLNSDYENALAKAEDALQEKQFHYFPEDAFLELQAQGFENPGQDLFGNLEQHPDLLQQSSKIHGRYFYSWGKPLHYGWYVAGFEDGHRAGKALLSYSIRNEQVYWKLLDVTFY